MSIRPMAKLQVVVSAPFKEKLIQQLMFLGCVEICSPNAIAPEITGIGWIQSDPHTMPSIQQGITALQNALALMDRYRLAHKSSLFPSPRFIDEQDLESPDFLQATLQSAHAINKLKADLDSNRAEEERLVTQKLSLLPWTPLDIPFEITESKFSKVLHGVCPSSVDLMSFEEKAADLFPDLILTKIHSDHELHYLSFIIHRNDFHDVEALLKTISFSVRHFKAMTGTASENIESIEDQLDALMSARHHIEMHIAGFREKTHALELCYDALTLKNHQASVSMQFLRSSRTAYFEGWVPNDQIDSLTQVFNTLECAYHFEAPQEEDDPPVAFEHHKIVAPFGIISALYGTPQYNSVIDPTPFMAPFFFIFFGMMMSDAAYGLILTLVAIWVLRKINQEGFIKQFFRLVLYCGLSTLIWGILFGSWFGDIVPAVTKMFTGTPLVIKPLWFDPLKQPMTMLYFSFALGGLQVIVGLGLSGWRQIRQGKWWNAVYDVGFWYMILFGLIMGLFKIPYGFEMALLGTAGVILTAGRSEKNLLKRFTSGILSLYSVTGYLSDILSYSRLLALGLASGVIASVINAMATIGGPSFGGIIALILIFTFGHLFNLAINLVGAYVHASRLQYVEFFSKFYEGGGRPFNPFYAKTKYVRFHQKTASKASNHFN